MLDARDHVVGQCRQHDPQHELRQWRSEVVTRGSETRLAGQRQVEEVQQAGDADEEQDTGNAVGNRCPRSDGQMDGPDVQVDRAFLVRCHVSGSRRIALYACGRSRGCCYQLTCLLITEIYQYRIRHFQVPRIMPEIKDFYKVSGWIFSTETCE